LRKTFSHWSSNIGKIFTYFIEKKFRVSFNHLVIN